MKNTTENTLAHVENEQPLDTMEMPGTSEAVSAALAGEEKFNVDASEATAAIENSKTSWGSKLKGWFSKGLDTVVRHSNKFVNEGYGADDVKAAWQKGKEVANKGVDFAGEKSVQFRDEGFDHMAAINKGKELASKGLDTVVNASNKFAEGYDVHTSPKMDRFIDKAKKFTEEGFEVNPAKHIKKLGEKFNKMNETVSTAMHKTVVEGGYKAVNGIRDYALATPERMQARRERKAEEKNQMVAERAKLQEMTASLAKSKNPEDLQKAKGGIFNQAKKLIAWGEDRISLAFHGGEEQRQMYWNTRIKFEMDGLREKIEKVGQAYKSKDMDSSKYNEEMGKLQQVVSKSELMNRFDEATKELMHEKSPEAVAA